MTFLGIHWMTLPSWVHSARIMAVSLYWVSVSCDVFRNLSMTLFHSFDDSNLSFVQNLSRILPVSSLISRVRENIYQSKSFESYLFSLLFICYITRCCKKKCDQYSGDYDTQHANYCYKSSCPTGFNRSPFPYKDM